MAKAVDGRSSLAKAIKGDLYSELREALTKPNSRSKKSFSQEFIGLMLSEAKKNPSGAIGQLIARQIMTDDIIEKLDAETDKYLARDIDFIKFRIMNTLYKEQRDVFLDDYRKKLVIGSRRIGKTELAARLLLSDTVYPNHHAVFISTKFENGIRQCFPLVSDLAKSLGLHVLKESKSEGEILFNNGSNILFKGNSNKAEADKLLGYKFSYAIIDESQTQINLMYLLDTVLRPAMVDYEDSRLVLLGTPPRIPHTNLETIWTKYKDWKKYSWDMSKNPYIPNVEEYIQGICRDKGVTEDAPFIQREMKGIWVFDSEAQVMANYKVYTDDKELANISPSYIVIGEDFGFADYNAIIGFAVDIAKQKAYCYFEWKQNKVGSTEIIAATKSAYDMGLDILRKSGINPDGRIKIFGDNSDGTLLYEMRKRHGLPTFNAYKFDKIEGIAKFSERSSVGDYLIPKDGILEEEYQKILYKRDEETDDITAELDDELFHPDAFYAALYASRFIEQLYLQDGESLEDYEPIAITERVAQTQDDLPDILKQNIQSNQRRSGFSF